MFISKFDVSHKNVGQKIDAVTVTWSQSMHSVTIYVGHSYTYVTKTGQKIDVVNADIVTVVTICRSQYTYVTKT